MAGGVGGGWGMGDPGTCSPRKFECSEPQKHCKVLTLL